MDTRPAELREVGFRGALTGTPPTPVVVPRRQRKRAL